MKRQEKVNYFSPARILNTILLTVILWSWAIPAAYFWHLIKDSNILIPHVPRLVWLIPGELWLFAPPLYIITLIGFPVIFYLFLIKKNSFNKLIRYFLIVILIIVVFINLLWGITLYKGLS